jgi:hypothetical protein
MQNGPTMWKNARNNASETSWGPAAAYVFAFVPGINLTHRFIDLYNGPCATSPWPGTLPCGEMSFLDTINPILKTGGGWIWRMWMASWWFRPTQDPGVISKNQKPKMSVSNSKGDNYFLFLMIRIDLYFKI